MSGVAKRGMERDTSPLSKRSRSAFSSGPDHDGMRDRMSPPDFDRRDRVKYESRDGPPGPGPGYHGHSEFLVHDGPPPPRVYENRQPPPSHQSRPTNESVQDYRSLYISGIPSKVPDQVVRDCLIDNYNRFGEMNVKITMSNDQRVAYLNFRYPEDAKEGLMKGIKFLFDRELKINPVYNKIRRPASPTRSVATVRGPPPPDQFYQSRHSPPPFERRGPEGPHYGSGGGSSGGGGGRDYHTHSPPEEKKSEKFPYHLHHVDPEYDDKATRTLFIGNLDVAITDFDMRNIFGKFGMVEDVDIKRPIRNTGNAYAFIKFINLDCAHRAKVEMSGKYIGRFQCKIGYGKVTPTTVVWVGGLGPWISVNTLESEFDRFGAIQHIEWPRNKNFAYVVYDSIDAAQAACQQMRGCPLGGPDKRLRLDFAEKEHIARCHNWPDFPMPYPPPKERTLTPSDQPSGPWREGQRSSERPKCDEWNRDGGKAEYRSPPPEPYRDEGRRREDYSFDRRPDNHRDRSAEFEKRPHPPQGQRSPERGRDYERGPPRVEERRVAERREFRGGSPNGDYVDVPCRTLAELAKMLPVAWNGALILKSSAFATRMHVVSGDVTLVDTLMRDPTSTESPILKITQRLRLDQPKLEDVGRRIQNAGPRGHCILLAMPSSLQNYEENTSSVQQRPLKNLVTYLKQKEAAGVISLPPIPISGKKDIGVLHAFPPCDFGYTFLRGRAPKLPSECTKEDHLVVVVVNGAA